MYGMFQAKELASQALTKSLVVYEARFTFLVPPKRHPVYTLTTNFEKEPYIHSPITEIQTLLLISFPKTLNPKP